MLRDFGDLTYNGAVKSEWLDYNNHMNLGYYLVVFDLATDGWFTPRGIAEATVRNPETIFALEAKVHYQNELALGDEFSIFTQLLGYDHNKIHLLHTMVDARHQHTCAMNELLMLNVSTVSRRSTNFSSGVRQCLSEAQLEHGKYLRPEVVGRGIKQIGFPGEGNLP